MPSESDLEKELTKAVRRLGGYSIKLPAIWYTGIPDRMLLLPGGRVHFIELKKTADLGPSKAQTIWLCRLARIGFSARALCGRDQVRTFISEELQ